MDISEITGFESLDVEFENTCALANGVDELVLAINEDNELTGDAVFADTVLKLNDIDLVALEGTEGFLDGIKKGAMKTYEWIKALIRSIRDWLTGKTAQAYKAASTGLNAAVTKIDNLATSVSAALRGGVNKVSASIESPKIVKETLRRLDSSTKAVVDDNMKLAAEAPIVAEKVDKLRSETIERITTSIKRQYSGIGKELTEVERIDPDHTTLKRLGVEDQYTKVQAGVKNTPARLDKIPDGKFSYLVSDLLRLASEAQLMLSSATTGLDRINESTDTEERAVSRAVAVVRHIGAMAARYRDLIITLNSQATKASDDIVMDITKQAVREAVKNTADTTTDYNRINLDEFMNA